MALRHEPDGAIVVEQLFVVPGHERRGVGRRLLDYVEGYAIAERAPALRIVVEQDNVRARDFYQRAGFVPVDARNSSNETVRRADGGPALTSPATTTTRL